MKGKFKSGQIFWGFAFLTVGALFFFVKYDVIDYDFNLVWDLWPIAFIFIGLLIILRDSLLKPFISGLYGIFIGLMVYGIFHNTIGGFSEKIENFEEIENEFSVKEFSEPFDDQIEFADLHLEVGVGSFVIKKTTWELVKGIARGSLGDYYFNTDKFENKAKIRFELEKKNFNFLDFDNEVRNKLEIRLNEDPVWDMNFEIGAAKAWFDLSDYKVRSVQLKTGATHTRIKMGDQYDKTNIDVEMGAASLEFQIPERSGCKVIGEMVLMSKDLYGFEKHDTDYYLTENYEDAEKKIIIKVNGGISSLKIRRY